MFDLVRFSAENLKFLNVAIKQVKIKGKILDFFAFLRHISCAWRPHKSRRDLNYMCALAVDDWLSFGPILNPENSNGFYLATF